jgi:hypothetical protein
MGRLLVAEGLCVARLVQRKIYETPFPKAGKARKFDRTSLRLWFRIIVYWIAVPLLFDSRFAPSFWTED